MKFLTTKFLAIISLTLIANTSFANTVTVDFESLEASGNFDLNLASSYSEDGYTLTTSGIFRNWGTSSADYRGSTALFSANSASTNSNVGPGNVSLIKSDNGVFDLISIDLFGQLFNPPFILDGFDPANVTFTGFKSDGSSLSQSFLNNSTFPTIFLFNNFNDLVRVDWSNPANLTASQFDNIVLSSVPVPAAVWLLGSALVGFFGFKRKSSI